MKLFHYTTENAIDGIRTSCQIKVSPDNKVAPRTISLTTDTSNEGHGLPDGREITSQQAQRAHHTVRNGKYYCHNHTLYRLTVELSEVGVNLQRATRRHDENMLLALDIAAWDPYDPVVPDHVIFETVQKFRSGEIKRKSPTWWYYLKEIPIDKIVLIEKLSPSGEYEVTTW